jgi:Ca2+:H+ antiporter
MRLNYLLVFIPIAFALRWFEANPVFVFVAAALSIIPLAGLMGRATECLASYLGQTIGGLLNASLGNAPEIIISMLALHKGLVDVVKASITGSVIGNLLLALGLAIFFGGIKHKQQSFNKTGAGMSSALLLVASAALIVPALFHHSTRDMTVGETRDMSLAVAAILLVVYILSLVFTLVTHKNLFQEERSKEFASRDAAAAEAPSAEPESEAPEWSKGQAIGILAAVTIVLAVVSETLTDALDPAAEALGLSPIFSGLILLAIVGNAAETMNSIRFAMANKMDLSFGIATGASTQIALLVVPLLVFSSFALGHPLDLLFSKFEVVAILLAVLVVSKVGSDGECNWFEGIMLVAVYLILAVSFFFLPT